MPLEDDMYLNTLNYYNTKAQEFYTTTVAVEFTDTQQRFLSRLPANSYILDFGCGSGRDTKAFLSQGHRVDAIDGSAQLCRLASEYTGIEVRNMLFTDLSDVDKYDGIWACSSILHLPEDELAEVMCKMVTALKQNGILYVSFKYGTFAGERCGRYFTDMNEETFAKFMYKVGGLSMEEQWVTFDVRPGRSDERWLNVILRKN